ncbi:MAG: CcmD family protein [Bacteroidetes bacterium]|nr:CcmD family protein [Bacteroidota bacterium]
MIKRIFCLLFLFVTVIANAQSATEPQMADTFRQEGKIYVVIAVLATIFVALSVFLMILDRKVKKLEEKINSKTP